MTQMHVQETVCKMRTTCAMMRQSLLRVCKQRTISSLQEAYYLLLESRQAWPRVMLGCYEQGESILHHVQMESHLIQKELQKMQHLYEKMGGVEQNTVLSCFQQVPSLLAPHMSQSVIDTILCTTKQLWIKCNELNDDYASTEEWLQSCYSEVQTLQEQFSFALRKPNTTGFVPRNENTNMRHLLKFANVPRFGKQTFEEHGEQLQKQDIHTSRFPSVTDPTMVFIADATEQSQHTFHEHTHDRFKLPEIPPHLRNKCTTVNEIASDNSDEETSNETVLEQNMSPQQFFMHELSQVLKAKSRTYTYVHHQQTQD